MKTSIINGSEVSKLSVAIHYLHKAKPLNKLGWCCMLVNIGLFLYLNNILFVDMIQRIAQTDDGYISVFDEEFTSEVARNIIWVIVSYIFASSFGGYLGAKKKYRID